MAWDRTLRTKKWASVYFGAASTPFIHCVADRQAELRYNLGKAWRHQGETIKTGWKRAFKGGWRIMPVTVAIFDDNEK